MQPIDGPKLPGEAEQVTGEVGVQEVQEAWGQRWKAQAPMHPLGPQQAGTGQQYQQQQPKEQHGQRLHPAPEWCFYLSTAICLCLGVTLILSCVPTRRQFVSREATVWLALGSLHFKE